jgi:DNA-binding transcriptional regulator YhcF (GntR family)
MEDIKMSADHQYNEKRHCLDCGKEFRRDQLVNGVCNKCIGKNLSNGKKCEKCGIDGVKLYSAYGKKICLNCFKKLKLYNILQYVESQFNPVSREECAKEFGIIPNTAEKYMSRLFHNGQLSRERKDSQYVYTSIKYSTKNFRHNESKKKYVGNSKKAEGVRREAHVSLKPKTDIDRLADAIFDYFPDEIGKGDFKTGEGAVDVAIRLLTQQKTTVLDQIEKLQKENRVLRDFVGMKYKEELCQLAIDAGRGDLVEWLDGLFGGDGK